MFSLLYVDDEPGLLDKARTFLEESGEFRVTTSTSASEAITSLQSDPFPFDAIISGYQMPGMNGIDFLKAVRDRYGTIPFILFTGRGSEEVAAGAVNNGADFYLRKGGDPYARFAELLDTVRQAVRRHQAGIAPAGNGRLYRDMVETQTGFITRFTPDGTCVFANEAYCRFFNRTRDEITGQRFVPPMPPGDRDLVMSHLASLSRERPVAELEHRVLMPDGSTRWVWWSNHALFDGAGRVTAYQSTGKDSTERKRVGEAQKESGQMFRVLADTAPVGIIVHHGEKIVYANNHAALATGYTREELCSMDFWEIVHPDCRELTKKIGIQTLNGEPVPARFQIEYVTKSGKTHTVDISGARIVYAGKPAVIAVMVSVTEQKRTANELLAINKRLAATEEELRAQVSALEESQRRARQSEQEYHQIIENILDPFYRTDMNDTLVMLNPAFVEHFGYTSGEELLGKNFRKMFYVHPAERDAFLENLQKSGKLREYRVTLRRRDDAHIIVSASSRFVYDRNGSPVGIEGLLHDMTDSVKAEDALAESERKYRLVADNVHDVIWTADRDMHLRYISPSVRTLLGYTPEQALSLPLEDVMTPRSFQVMLKRREDAIGAMNKGEAIPGGQVMELEFIRADGSLVYAELSVSPLYDSRGMLVGELGVTRDITQRKRAEKAMQESQEKFQKVLENIPDLIVVHRDGMILYVNPAMKETLGINSEEALQKSMLDFIAPDDHGRAIKAARKRIETGFYEPYEVRLLSRKGTPRSVLIRGTVIQFEGSPAILNVLTDITERKKAQQALVESEEKFRSYVENANDIVFSMTPDAIITYISPRVTDMLGYNPGDLIGKKATNYVHPSDLPPFREKMRHCIESGEKISGFEFRVKDRDGTWQWHSQRGSIIRDAGGDPVAYLGISHDITERKRAEEALHRANRQLNLLTEVTRHDLLNKIMVIQGFLDFVEMKSTDPGLTTLLKKIESATMDMKSMIEFTRIYQALGSQEPQWLVLDRIMPRQYVPETIMMKTAVEGISVFADPMLEKVLFNLLDNSVRHGGRVIGISITSHESGGDLVLIWEDNGIGIPDEHKERIFEKKFGKNTGLGMFLIREILSLTGITIRETGVPGKGARFEILIPKGAFKTVRPGKGEKQQ